MPADIKITTELLYKGALVFALMDAVYISLLVWRINEESFRRLKWSWHGTTMEMASRISLRLDGLLAMSGFTGTNNKQTFTQSTGRTTW